jgi:hypothetical protein
MDDRLIKPECQRTTLDESLVVGRPVSDLELLLCHGKPRQDQEYGDLILIAVRSSIYSTKPVQANSSGKR